MNKNSKLVLWALIPLALLALLCRMWQLVTCVDYTTGFFTDESGFWGISLYMLLGASAAVIAVLCVLDHRRGSSSFTKIASDLSSKQTAALGLAFLALGCFTFYDIIKDFSGKITLPVLVSGLLSLAALAVAFILLSSKSVKPSAGYLMILLAVGYTVKSAMLFISDTVVVRESDKLLTLLSYIAAVLFYLALGRFLSNNEANATRLKLIFFAGAAFLLNIAGIAASFAVILAGPSPINAEVSVSAVSELGTCVIAITTLVCLYKKSGVKALAEEINA